ncbi:hypothetical protein PV328_001217 [Microctonus aethiopoides]|uniref:Uncharacterized protein n=1 Tax=Microctonus aethiopoides TaxID=144406 RepID=A0AA39FWQ7_9HYME|nr:hypothetical protein PV328_001217 [Microctonus aethiopoides]
MNHTYNVVLSKLPKARFHGTSKSLHPRVEAAVCQSNEGTFYIIKINENLRLSPGKYTEKFRESKDKLHSEYYDSSGGLDNISESIDESELDLMEEVDLEKLIIVVTDLETNGFITQKAEISQCKTQGCDI